jgi:hypothetical protein
MNLLLLLLLQITSLQKQQVFTAANKLMPGVNWRQSSVLAADFTCRGRTEYAILGTVKSEAAERTYAIVAVFLDGLNKQPAIIEDHARNAALLELTLESLESGPEEAFGRPEQGFEHSKTCKGLDLADGQIDSMHIYWNHYFHDFFSWSL